MPDFPKDFVDRIRVQRMDADLLLDALDSKSPISVRLNPYKKSSQWDHEESVLWCSNGKYLNQRPSFTKDPLFHAGTYYPQEAGSMFIDEILKQLDLRKDCIALDLCASPGGKSTVLLDNLSNSSLLVSNEIARSRAFVLRDNLTRWGKANVIVTNKSASDFGRLSGLFDLVLVDAPCSGEGMFRKDLNARLEWTSKNASLCAVRQTDILNDVWSSILEGGYLIYSTCTFNPEENYLQIHNFMKNHACELVKFNFPTAYDSAISRDFIIENQEVGYSCYPHLIKTEGFYFCVLRKLDAARSFSFNTKKDKKKPTRQPVILPNFDVPDEHELLFLNESFFIAPSKQSNLMVYLQENFSCMKLGVRLGEFIGNKWNPHFEYALSLCQKTSFESAELNLENALSYLKGNAIEVDGLDGWRLMTFQGHSLGWLKKIGNRSNNYYPKELRIKMDL
jgi:16S rRNA C967 or C1407 C5-methylase (RsmB/RsmF family)/NOL1/NOP2/fmu family ribosome biogenesis protein